MIVLLGTATHNILQTVQMILLLSLKVQGEQEVMNHFCTTRTKVYPLAGCCDS